MQQITHDYPPAGEQKMANVVNLATAMCSAFLNGATPGFMASKEYTAGVSPGFVGALFVDGTHYFCPSETAKVRSWLNSRNSGP